MTLARPMAEWIETKLRGKLEQDACFVPVPLHWSRLLKRRFNQAAVLANALSRITGHPTIPDALWRTRRTAPMEQLGFAGRYALLDGALMTNPRRRVDIAGRQVVLVDDVMTSGATLTAAAHAIANAQPGSVAVAVAARVVKD